MSLFRTNIKKFVNIKYIIYNDFINLKTDIKIPDNDTIIDGEYIKEKDLLNIKNDYIGRILKMHDNDYYIHKQNLINVSTKLKEEINKYTYFQNSFELWNITNLVRKYNIIGKDIFLSMTKDNEEFNQKWLEKEVINDYKHFDYCNHKAIKNSFSIDINKNETTLNLRRYVERGNFNGYKQLINMLEEKITEEPNYNNLLLSNLIKEDEKINNNKKINKNEIIIPSMDLKDKTLFYFNQNNDKKCKIKEHMEFYNMIINGKKEKIFNLSNYFSYNLRPNYDLLKIDEKDLNNYILTPRNETELSNLSIINCIIFGEDNIRFEDINKLMTLVRFKSIHYSIILDNINISHYDGQSIKINSDDKELNEMEFCKYLDILECCKWLIQIMNNINPELINHHNYHTLVEYCKKYDNYYEQRFNNLIFYEKYRIEQINFE
jgi:hypothetical protein